RRFLCRFYNGDRSLRWRARWRLCDRRDRWSRSHWRGWDLLLLRWRRLRSRRLRNADHLVRRDPLNVHDQTHQNEAENDYAHCDQQTERRFAIAARSRATMAHHRCASWSNSTWFRRRLVLQIRITIDSNLMRRLE